jgi:hypothetical protein
MKKLTIVFLLCSTLLLSACSGDKKADTTDSTRTKLTTSSSTQKKEAISLDSILEKFKDDGLTVDEAKYMNKEDFGMAPMSAKEAKIFGIQKDDSGDYMNGRIFLFEKEKDLTKTKDYYDELGKESAMAFSYTAANEKKLILMQFNGDLSQDLVQKYADSAGLKLTPLNFASSADSNTQNSTGASTSSSNTVNEESYEEMKQRTLKSTPTDRVNWTNKEWEAFGMALSENGLAMDDNGYIITQAQKDQLEAERQKSKQQTEFQGGHGAPKVVTSEAQAVQIAQSQFGDNGGAWTWGPMGEVEDGYFVKAIDPNDGTMTHTAKSVIVHYDGTVTEN